MALAEVRVSGSEADNEDARIAVSRRTLFAGLVAAAAIGTIGEPAPAPSLADRIAAMAHELAALMQEMHGGAWRTTVDHDVQLVLVARDF